MRNVYYINRESTIPVLWTVLTEGDLVIVPTEEWAERTREMIRSMNGKPLQDVIEAEPMSPVDLARNESVEVRTQAEMEQMEFNEKQAMEVL